MITYNGYFEMSCIDRTTEKQLKTMTGSRNFQVREKIYETKKSM